MCGIFLVMQVCLLYFKCVVNLYVLMLVLLFMLDFKWFGLYVVYIIVKMGMSLCVLGMVEEFCFLGIVVNVLWLCMVIVIVVIVMIGGVCLE